MSFIGLIVGLIVLAFLPYTNRASTLEEQARLKKKGNLIGGVTAVVGIVLVIGVVGISNYIVATQRQKISQTVSKMKGLATAIGSYQVDKGHFPLQPNEDILSREILPIEYAGDNLFQDGWGGSFRYHSDGKTYRLISYGKDQQAGKTSGLFDEDIVFSNGRLVAPDRLVR
jgi:type II secretory pathway pseudopilin PulG